MRCCLILFVLVAVQAAWAQEASPPPLVPAPSEPEPPPRTPPAWQLSLETPPRPILLERGDRVRVETAQGQRASGELVSLTPGALSLQASPEQVLTILLKDVQELEKRKRSPAQGAVVGGSIGGVGGGVLMALLCIAVGEGDDSAAPFCAGLGALVGGAFGAGVGAIVGLTVPRWSPVYEQAQGPLSLRLEEPEEGSFSNWFSGRGPLGEVGIQLGYAREMGIANPTDGWGGRLHLLALVGPYLAIGPEVAWYKGVGTETFIPPGGPAFTQERSLFQLGGLIRGGVDVGPTRTSVLLGMGFQESRSAQFAASLGGEIELRLWEHVPPMAVEVRYSFPVDRDEFEDVQNFLSFGLGTRLRW